MTRHGFVFTVFNDVWRPVRNDVEYRLFQAGLSETNTLVHDHMYRVARRELTTVRRDLVDRISGEINGVLR